MPLRITLASLIFAFGIVTIGFADDPPVDRAVIDAQLKQRRENLKQLEQWIDGERNEIKRQMSDVVVGQQDAVAKAQKEYDKAQEATKVARYQVQEYLKGIYPQDKATYAGMIALAQVDLDLAIDREKTLRNLAERGVVDRNELVAADLAKQQAQFDLEQAKLQLEVLEKYTKDKQTKVRQAAVAGAEATEAEKKGLLAVEQAREAKYREQSTRLRARSPEDFVIALMEDAVQNEGKAVAILAEAIKLEDQIRDRPQDAASLNAKLVARKNEAVALMNQAKTQLLESVSLAEMVKVRRNQLKDAEARLVKDRQTLEMLEQQLGPKK
jgi:hypothetical protein